ncbi:hypothetical protein [Carboxylicivirga sp. N1Y90]|uniref:hypothetical protein n=1 Tax=Carboxylicivirga fragile TaxID=3417571 RepID=UPI003D33654D|nr:hypothetical protein [Marinilabiliaceae bacterium N1Y90]
MRIKILALCVMLSLHYFVNASIVDISFTNQDWTYSSGVTQSANKIEIIGSSTGYRTASLVVDIPANTSTLYLVADVYFENIVCGDAAHKAPKFKMYKSDGSKYPVLNFYNPLEKRWVTTGLKIEKNSETQITIEFGIQSATGTMVIKNPQLLSTAPSVPALEFPFDVPADKICYLDIDLQSTRPFNNDKLSSNTHFTWADYGWADDEVHQVIYEHFPMTNLRFPGGTVGNFYDWRRDGYYENQYSYDKGYSMDHRVGYPGFEAFSLSSGASSTLMFNVISETVEVAKQRLQDRIDGGLDIAWIEMGNENYFIGTQGIGQVDSEENYILHTTDLAAGLKEVISDVKVAVNIEHGAWEAGGWNYNLAQENYYDATVMHGYVQTNTFLLNPISAFTMLNAYKTTQERFEAYKNLFGNTPLLMTEWNVLSDDTPLNFIQTLSITDLFLAIEEEEVVKQAGIHMLFKNEHYHESTLTYNIGSQMVLTANGVVYAKLFDVFKDKQVYSALSTSADLEPGLPAVNARAVDHGDEVKVLAVNKLPEPATLNLQFGGQSYAGAYTLEYFHEDVNQVLTDPYNSPEQAFVSQSASGIISLPAYSIAVVSIAKSDIPTSIESSLKETETISYSAQNKTIRIKTDSPSVNWRLYSMSGVEVDRGDALLIHVNHLNDGMYIIQTNSSIHKVLIY